MPGSSFITAAYILRRRAAFTLVEMLVVMGIIVLLLAATLPALRGLNQSESRRGAVGNMMGVLDRARMMAISDGLATYVVFSCPTDPTQINADLRGRAYAIFEDGDNVTFIPTQKTPWMSLPKGMAFKVKADVANDCISARFASLAPTPTDLSFPLTVAASPSGSGGNSVQMPYWKFDATGAVTEQKYLRLLMFPGSIDAGGNEVSTQVIGGSATEKGHLLEEIALNQATGRAKYIIDPANNLSTPSSTPSPTP